MWAEYAVDRFRKGIAEKAWKYHKENTYEWGAAAFRNPATTKGIFLMCLPTAKMLSQVN